MTRAGLGGESSIALRQLRIDAISAEFPAFAVLGLRKGSKYVRFYYKEEIDKYRVELELHAKFLRSYRIRDTVRLPEILRALADSAHLLRALRRTEVVYHASQHADELRGDLEDPEGHRGGTSALTGVKRVSRRAQDYEQDADRHAAAIGSVGHGPGGLSLPPRASTRCVIVG